ncbi:MAG: type VII secretion protein EccE [Actinobacteria bacterium]|nr:type VII secretion protein EccE [Actinomycetota bacterium]MBI3687215.1 type VII secretion protein EccE [Actinomycetota bacterium]
MPGHLLGLSVGQITAWQASLAAVLAAAVRPGPPTIAAGVLAIGVLALTVVRRRGRWLYQAYGVRSRFRARQRVPVPAGPADPRLAALRELLPDLDLTGAVLRSGKRIGIIHDGQSWIGLVAVQAGTDIVARPQQVGWLPVRDLAGALVVDDIDLASVQVLRYITPAPTGMIPSQAPAAASYQQVNRLRTPGDQHLWVAVRLDPAHCPDAIEVRGGGVEGVHRAVRRCIARILELLDSAGVAGTPLDEETVRSVLALSAGTHARNAPPGTRRSEETWTHWRGDGTVHVSWWVRSWPVRGIPMKLLQEAAAAVPALSCSISLTLHPERTEGARFRCLVRLSAPSPAAANHAGHALLRACHTAGIGLYRLDGEQALGLVATLPLGGGRL